MLEQLNQFCRYHWFTSGMYILACQRRSDVTSRVGLKTWRMYKYFHLQASYYYWTFNIYAAEILFFLRVILASYSEAMLIRSLSMKSRKSLSHDVIRTSVHDVTDAVKIAALVAVFPRQSNVDFRQTWTQINWKTAVSFSLTRSFPSIGSVVRLRFLSPVSALRTAFYVQCRMFFGTV